MKQALTIFLTGLAVAGAVTLVSARSPQREHAAAQPQAPANAATAYAQAGDDTASVTVPITIFAPRFTSSPRIIHVTRPDMRDESREDSATAEPGIDNDYVAPPRPPMVKRIKRAPRADVPPPAPQPALTERPELSPVYPTPRFSKSSAAVPRDPPIDVPPPPPAAVDTPPPPPVGYTPPSDLSPEQK